MPYTAKSAPDWVKELPEEARDAWVGAFNAAYKEYNGDEGRSNATASATIKKMGYKKGGDGKWHKSKEAAVEHALTELSVFGEGAEPQVTAVTEEHAVVTVKGKTYRVPYVEKAGAFVFGQATEEAVVTEPMKARESLAIELTVAEDSTNRVDIDGGDFPVVIIEAGENKAKRRAYTDRSVSEANVTAYEGLPMHIDHAGTEGDNKPRSVREMAAVVKRAWHAVSESGRAQIRGMVHVFDPWLKSNMADPAFRKLVGLSHVADVAGRVDRVGKMATQVIESIVQPYAVDFVSKAAFGGRVTESQEPDPLAGRMGDIMALETLTIADLKAHRSDLVELLVKEGADSVDTSAAEKQALADAANRAAKAEERAVAAEAKWRAAEVSRLAAAEVAKPEHAIPEAARPKLVERAVTRLQSEAIADDKLAERVAETVKVDADFGATFRAAPKVNVPGGGAPDQPAPQPTGLERVKTNMERAFGVHNAKKD